MWAAYRRRDYQHQEGRCLRCGNGSVIGASGARIALNKERAGRSPREGEEIGYMSVGKGNKSRRGTSGTGGV
jgi:hypothetical protein